MSGSVRPGRVRQVSPGPDGRGAVRRGGGKARLGSAGKARLVLGLTGYGKVSWGLVRHFTRHGRSVMDGAYLVSTGVVGQGGAPQVSRGVVGCVHGKAE